MGFPYLQLPDLPQELVIKQLDVTDIIILSLASEKSKEIVKKAKVKVGLSWKIGTEGAVIKVKPLTGKRQILSIESSDYAIWNDLLVRYLMLSQPNGPLSPLYRPRIPYQPFQLHPFPFKFGNFQVFMVIFGSRLRVVLKSKSHLQTLDLTDIISYHLFDIFQVTQPISFISFENRQVPNYIQDFQGKISKFSISKCSADELTMFLDQLSVINLELNGRRLPGFNYDRPLRPRKIYLTDGSWLSIDNLIDMKCTSLRAYDVENLTNQDVITFANHWINGGCSQLKSLYFSHYRNLKIDSSIFDQLETIPSLAREFPYPNGKDIRRASDGKRATLAVFEQDTFRFDVCGHEDSDVDSDLDDEGEGEQYGEYSDDSVTDSDNSSNEES